jgi:acyl carrier protein
VPDLRVQVLAEIRRVLSTDLEVGVPVEPHHELVKDLRVDSMGAIVLAVALEDRFRVKLADEDAAAVVTVRDLVDLVERACRDTRADGASEAEGRQDAQ